MAIYSSASTSDYTVIMTMGVAIGSRTSGGVLAAPRPTFQITDRLDGVQTVWSSSARTVILEVSGPNQWSNVVGRQGSVQTLTLINDGTEILEVQAPIFSDVMTRATPVYTGLNYSAPPWVISTGSSATFGISYTSNDIGVFNEAIWFSNNGVGGLYRYDLTVASGSSYQVLVEPSNYSTSTWLPNQNSIVTYDLTAYSNEVELDSDTGFSISLAGSTAWSIDSIGVNTFDLRFNSTVIANVTGTYVATATITAPGLSSPIVVTNTATHSVNNDLNYSSVRWFSNLTRPDAVVGARIDYIQADYTSTISTRLLTLGVGSGGDGSRPLSDGMLSPFREHYLDPIWSRGGIINPFWQTVYSIPLLGTTTTRTYLSKDFRTKTQEPDARDYDYYFGHEEYAGTLFVITESAMGDVTIGINDLREDTDGADQDLDDTLDRLQRVFYYYSDQDAVFRDTATWHTVALRLDEFGRNVYSTTSLASSAVDLLYTEFFRGFDDNDNTVTSLVLIPT